MVTNKTTGKGKAQLRPRKSPVKTDYIVVDAKLNGAFLCKRCRTAYHPEYPVHIGEYQKLMKTFMKEHKECEAAEDINGREIKVGDTVKLYFLIGRKDSAVIAQGEVYSLSGMHGNPKKPMVWINGQAAHHPGACEVLDVPMSEIP